MTPTASAGPLDFYRAEVRRHAREIAPDAPALRGPGASPSEDERIAQHRDWQRRLADEGLSGIAWPLEHGGRGLSPAHEAIAGQELAYAGVPGAFDIVGTRIAGPALLAYGTREQKDRHLKPLLRGDEVWCQAFSEPGAGSDLRALRTRAELLADGSWLLTGQKVWTTWAHHASFSLVLARSDDDRVTLFIVGMSQPGVTVRPLRNLSGERRFAEVFFDRVALAAESVVGAVGGGWEVARHMLALDRLALGSDLSRFGWRPEDLAAALAAHASDPVIAAQLGPIACELLAVRWAAGLELDRLAAGELPAPARALAKVTGANSALAGVSLICDTLGDTSLSPEAGWTDVAVELEGLRMAGGTEAIVRTTVARRVLGSADPARSDGSWESTRWASLGDESLGLLRETAREAFAQADCLGALRRALDGGPAPSAWPLAKAAGWPGVALEMAHGGAGLGIAGAAVICCEAGRALAAAHLVPHVTATVLLGGPGGGDDAVLADLAAGKARASVIIAPPGAGTEAGRAAQLTVSEDRVSGVAHSVAAASGADLIVVAGRDGASARLAVVRAGDGIIVAELESLDPSQPLARVRFDAVRAATFPLDEAKLERAWATAQILHSAESAGAAERLLELSVAHTRRREAFGRPIGDFQAMQLELSEVLRRLDNARSLMLQTLREDAGEGASVLHVSALRWLADDALSHAARTAMTVHGALGVTWEHDVGLYWRRAEQSRRLDGGKEAARRVGRELLERR